MWHKLEKDYDINLHLVKPDQQKLIYQSQKDQTSIAELENLKKRL